MALNRRVAVLVVRTSRDVDRPDIDLVRRLFSTGGTSIAQYFRDTSYDWLRLAPVDVYGTFTVVPDPGGTPRGEMVSRAARQAVDSGRVDLSGYDVVVVFGFPGGANDAGASGTSSYLPADSTFSFFTHEVAHNLGFSGHSFGIDNRGATWGDPTLPSRPVYGDPYDLMSAETYGGANPRGDRPAGDVPAQYPGWGRHGPHVSRALLHLVLPDALETNRKAVHLREGTRGTSATLTHTGSSSSGHEVLVWHPAVERPAGRGRVYVEYRQAFADSPASRWDSGLADQGEALDLAGVVVHVVRDHDTQPTVAVPWYAGRIVLPTPDADVTVETPTGPVTVSVTPATARSTRPRGVQVSVTRANAPAFTAAVTQTSSRRVVHTDRRVHPRFEWAGEFTWEEWRTTVNMLLRPTTVGLGGESPEAERTDITVAWWVGATRVPEERAQVRVAEPGGTNAVLNTRLRPDTGELSVSNVDRDEPIRVTVVGRAWDSSRRLTSGTFTFEAPSRGEGWGEDWKAFERFWREVRRPIPKTRLGVPPQDVRVLEQHALELDRAYEAYRAVGNGGAAAVENAYRERKNALRHAVG